MACLGGLGEKEYLDNECRYYVSDSFKIIESIYILAITLTLMRWGYNRLFPIPKITAYHMRYHWLRKFLLVALCLTIGTECGFKIVSGKMIHFFYPCHVVVLVQIYILAAPADEKVTGVFRAHLCFFTGPLLAFMFPDTADKQFGGEIATFYIQHVLIFAVPICLLLIGGPYNVEPLTDLSWPFFAFGMIAIYFVIVLQVASLTTSLNLVHMVCPHPQDPFQVPFYKTCAMVYFFLSGTFMAKLLSLIFARSRKKALTFKEKGS